MHASVNVGCQGKSGPGKIHEVILVTCSWSKAREAMKQLVVVLLLIGWKSGANLLSQSRSVVNAKPITFRHSNETTLTTSHNINWDHFDISALTELSLESYQLFIQELKLSLNVNDDSENLLIY